MNQIEEIEQLVVQNEYATALQLLLLFFSAQEQEELRNDTLLLQARFNEYRRKVFQGILREGGTELNQISLSILELKSKMAVLLQSPGEQQTASENAVETHVGDGLILKEDFLDNRNQWDLKPSTQGDRLISVSRLQDGRLIFERFAEEASNSFEYLHLKMDAARDFRIQTKIGFIAFDSPQCAAGLYWGAKDSANYFQFLISMQGQFLIQYKIDGGFCVLQEWTASSSIDLETRINVMQLDRKAHLYHFYLNGQLVFSCPFVSFFGDRIGVSIQRRVKVFVDEFEVYS